MSNSKSQNSTNSTNSKYSHGYSPRHPLAKYAVSQISKREQRAQDIVQAMGYPQTHTISACDRLRHVLSSDILGLNGCDIDTYFTAHEFLRALLAVLDIRYETFAEDIAQIEYDLVHYSYPLPIYHLRAYIKFEFTAGSNWMSRGFACQLANAYLPRDLAKTNDSEREVIIQKYMREHYKKYHGNLPYDGIIKGYQLIVKQRNEVVDRVEYGLPVEL